MFKIAPISYVHTDIPTTTSSLSLMELFSINYIISLPQKYPCLFSVFIGLISLIYSIQEEANRKQQQSSPSYAVEDSDIPPPRYQKDGRLSPYYHANNHNQMLIHPKNLQMQNPSQMSFLPSSNYDDQLTNQKNYIKIPSPGPPLDGSYYSACDRYLSYPPMVRVSVTAFLV